MNSENSILVIDDEAVVCESFTRILSNEGYKVDTIISPQEGLDLAISKKYNLVFLDLKMEEMDGIDLFHKLREKEPDLPVIIVTGYPSMDTALECIKLHASDYIIKPFTPDDILKLTKQIIPEVSPLSPDVEEKLAKKTVFQEWKPSDKPILFHETAWLQQGEDGTVRAGGQLPDFIAKYIMDLMLPKVNDITYPGLPLAGALLNDNSRIMIPSPLSGKIIDVNYELVANPSIIKENSFDESWIARIDPVDLEKDLSETQIRNIILLSKSADEVKEYINKLVNMGYGVDCVGTVCKAITALKEEKNKVVFINAESFSDEGPEFVQEFNLEIPDVKVVVIGKPDSELEEAFRRNKILYYCISSLFDKEITDILFSVFSAFKQDIEVVESCPISIIPQSISRIHITNKHSKKVTLLIFGDLLYNNKGIGNILINKLKEKSFPLEVTRSINRSCPDDHAGRQKIANEKEKNDLIINLLAKNNNKIPGQIHKEVEIYTNSFGSDVRVINLVIQPNNDETKQLIFNNTTTKAVAELIYNEMTSKTSQQASYDYPITKGKSKTNNLIKVCGSFTKKESMVPVNYNILKNTCVAEANFPYSGYYRTVPGQTNPNSLFLFTTHYYSLEEVLRFAQNIDSCYMEKVNVATAWLYFAHHKYSAIRVKCFPDYEHIHLLQSCCIKEGVKFAKKIQISNSALVKINKCFVLEEIEEGIYIDKKEDHKGYITIPHQVSDKKFSDILINIKNNDDCELFDAVMGAIIIDSKANDMVRIYSESLNLRLLKCIKKRFIKSMLNK